MSIKSIVSNGVATVQVSGEFEFSLHQTFRQASDNCFSHGAIRRMVVDMSQATYIDSSALGLLLVLKDRAISEGVTDISIAGAHGMVRNILQVTHFHKFYQIDPIGQA